MSFHKNDTRINKNFKLQTQITNGCHF